MKITTLNLWRQGRVIIVGWVIVCWKVRNFFLVSSSLLNICFVRWRFSHEDLKYSTSDVRLMKFMKLTNFLESREFLARETFYRWRQEALLDFLVCHEKRFIFSATLFMWTNFDFAELFRLWSSTRKKRIQRILSIVRLESGISSKHKLKCHCSKNKARSFSEGNRETRNSAFSSFFFGIFIRRNELNKEFSE